MWKYRTRRGKSNKEDRGIEENIIEVHDPKEGLMVYRPSCSLMPARPLGANPELPIIAPVVKKEIEDNEAESDNCHTSVFDAVTESSNLNTTQIVNVPLIDALTENASSDNAPKIKIKTEPLDDVSDNIESSLVNENVESSGVEAKNTPELDQHEAAEADSLEKNSCGSLALWNLESMFGDVPSQNLDDQPQLPASHFDSQITFQPFKTTYLDFCLDLDKKDVEESLRYLNSSFPNIKKNPLFCLEVPSQNSIASTSVSEETDSVVKCDISTEALRKILAVSNSPSVSSNLPDQKNSQLFQSEAPHQQISKHDCSGIKQTIQIKKEPVSPNKSEPYSHLVDADKKNASIKSNSAVSGIQSVHHPDSSKIVPQVSVSPKKCAKKRKKSDDIELDWTVAIKKEPISPQKAETSNKRKNSFDMDVNASKKHVKQEAVPVENFVSVSSVELENTGPVTDTPASCHLNIADKSIIPKEIEAARFEEVNHVVTRSSSVEVENTGPVIDTAASCNLNVVDKSSKEIEAARFEEVNHVVTPKQTLQEFEANKAQIPASNPPPYNNLPESPSYETPLKKIKLTPKEYLQRKSYSASSNSIISKCSSPQASLMNPLHQLSQMDNSSESLTRDPRLQKCVLNTPSNLGSQTSHNIARYERGQNIYTSNSNLSRVSFKSSVPFSRERPSSQEFKESLKAQQISQCDARSQNVFEPRRGNNNSVMKQLREKIGRRFIAPGDVTGIILDWNVSWLGQQKKTSIVPQIINDKFSYPEVKSTYDSVESYYNTYLPLHLLNIWMGIYKTWEREDFLPESTFEGKEEKTTYVKILCSMRLNAANRNILPKTEDILICHVDGHHKKLFGKVVRVDNMHNSLLGSLDDVNVKFEIICAENFDVNSRRTIKLQKLCNIRLALHICHALKYMNSFMRLAILNPRDQGSQIELIRAKPFNCAKYIKDNMEQIKRSTQSRSHSITLVHTEKPAESLKAMIYIVPEIVRLGGLIFLCMKEETTFVEMARDMTKYDLVLAVKEEDVPRLPRELSKFTIKNRLKDLERCQVVLTLMSAMFIGELETRLQKDSLEQGKNAVCVIPEAQKFLETETSLLLEQNFKSLILLGRKELIEDVEAKLKRQFFHKSLFYRIMESNT